MDRAWLSDEDKMRLSDEPGLYTPEEAAEAEAVRAGVPALRDYYYGVNNDLLLRNTANYAYCAWADDIESRSGAEKAILWATHKLLGKSLDTDATSNT